MEEIPEGSTIDCRLLQPLKADSPMEVTVEGMVTEVRLLKPFNVLPDIVVSPGSKATEVTPVHPENRPTVVFAIAGIVMDAKLVHPA